MSWFSEEPWDADEKTEHLNTSLFGTIKVTPYKGSDGLQSRKQVKKKKTQMRKMATAGTTAEKKKKGSKRKLSDVNPEATGAGTAEQKVKKKKKVKKASTELQESANDSSGDVSGSVSPNTVGDQKKRKTKRHKKANNKYKHLAGLTKEETFAVLAGEVPNKTTLKDIATDIANTAHKPISNGQTDVSESKVRDGQLNADTSANLNGKRKRKHRKPPKGNSKNEGLNGSDMISKVKSPEDNHLISLGETDTKKKKKKQKRKRNQDISVPEKKPQLEKEEGVQPERVPCSPVIDDPKRTDKGSAQGPFNITKLKRALSARQSGVQVTPGKSVAESLSKEALPNESQPDEADRLSQGSVRFPGNRVVNRGSLKERMTQRLQQARFRFLNETMYTRSGRDAFEMFAEDESAFHTYHEGYQSQVSKWPHNPVEKMIFYIKSKRSSLVVADFGCGDAKIARTVPNKVHSFDLVAINEHVTACDMSKVPLKTASVDIAVFCLSLMGTNFVDYLVEASRVLKKGGVLLVAEVVSRFDRVGAFIRKIGKLGFTLERRDENNEMFVWFEFHKTAALPPADHLPKIELMPCLYKKR